MTGITPSELLDQKLLHVQHQEPNGTDGGNAVAGDNQRPLNTIVTNDIAGASLGSNQITLPAGNYYVEAISVGNQVGSQYTKLLDTTGATDLLQSVIIDSDTTIDNVLLSGNFSLSVQSDLEINHVCQLSNGGNGLGEGFNGAIADANIFADIRIWKIK